jgi:large repetitive protein
VDRTGLDSPNDVQANPGGSFTIDPDGSDNFTYKAGNGASPDQAAVDVQEDSSGNFDGDGDSEIIVGTNSGETLNGNGGKDVLFGGGGTDTLNGGDGDDWLVYDTADGTINGGNDFDTLRFETALNIDIDDDNGGNSFDIVNRVNNIEAIDLRNGNAGDVFGNTSGDEALSAADVINMTDADATLYIMGDGNGAAGGDDDEVRLSGNWAVGATATVNDPAHADIHGLTFTQYTLGGATVYVQNTVEVDNNSGG